MIINGLRDLDHYTLQKNDIVVFHVENKYGELLYLKYDVEDNFLMIKRNIFDSMPSFEHYNDAIFTALDLDPYEFCSKHYGYAVYDGKWPFYKDYDYEAATNVVKALYTLIDAIKMSKSAGSCSPTIGEDKKQESEIVNHVKESITKHTKVRTIKQDNNSKLKHV